MQYYEKMMIKTKQLILRLIEQSDIILFVIDARFPKETFSEKYAKLIENKNKPLIIVANKADLVDYEKEKEIIKMFSYPVILFSAKNRWGTKKLKMTIYELGEKFYPKKEKYDVGLIGFPNVGKSSIISIMSHAKAKPSTWAGFTRGLQKVRINRKIAFWDSPGYIETKDETTLALIGAINPEKLEDVITPAEIILKNYDVSLEDVAIALNYLKKNSQPDLERAAREIIRAHLKGKIGEKIQKILSKLKR